MLETSDEVVSNINAVKLRLNRGGYRAHCGKEENGSWSNLHGESLRRIELQEREGCSGRDGQAYLEGSTADGIISGLEGCRATFCREEYASCIEKYADQCVGCKPWRTLVVLFIWTLVFFIGRGMLCLKTLQRMLDT